jgi:hypothetical protein
LATQKECQVRGKLWPLNLVQVSEVDATYA